MGKENDIRHPMHPNSLANLKRNGRAKAYDTDKKKRQLTVTEPGWEGVVRIAELAGCSSVSDLLEKIGRGNLTLCASPENLEDSDRTVPVETFSSVVKKSNPSPKASTTSTNDRLDRMERMLEQLVQRNNNQT